MWLGGWWVAGVAMKKTYTDKQGQYLAFIYYYSKIHGCAPSEAEMQQYFRVSPPSVHQMILTLEARGLLERTPGQARSIHLLISPDHLPDLA
jgi:repressor LexA